MAECCGGESELKEKGMILPPDSVDIKSGELAVDSIHCASCVNLIEGAVKGLSGIQSVRVNLTRKRASIVWDDGILSLDDIINEINSIGHTAYVYEIGEDEKEIRAKNKLLLYRIAFAGFSMMNMMWITVALYSGAMDGKYAEFFEVIGFLLATPTLFYSGWPFLSSAVKGLMKKSLNMDLPITIGAIATYLYSTYIMINGNGGVFFDTVVNFIFIILIGRYLESKARENALSKTNNLRKIEPVKAILVKDGKEQVVGVKDLVVGDIIVIRPGEIIPVDGMVIWGMAGVDESIVSGESEPVGKTVGNEVISGAISMSGNMQIVVAQTYNDSTLSRIIKMTENVEPGGTKIVSRIDKVIPYFIGATLGIATGTFIYWSFHDIEFAIMSAVSVLIITCPCALGLASPMAFAVAAGVGAEKKILFKSGNAMEILSKVNKIIFDKTGTLTSGNFKISKIRCSIGEKEFIRILASIERLSEHPISKSIAGEHLGELSAVSEFQSYPGEGVEGIIDGVKYRIGSVSFVSGGGIISDSKGYLKEANLGFTTVACSNDRQVLGVVLIEDVVKEDAVEEIQKLHKMGFETCIISGDNEQVVKKVSLELGIKEYYYSKKPDEKKNLVALMNEKSNILMVGDGINDAPALKKASVSISYSSGFDLASKNSDIVSLGSGVRMVREAIRLSTITSKTIKQNIYWAIVYNIAMVPMAVMGMITPLFAAIAMPISSIVVISNAGLIKFKSRK